MLISRLQNGVTDKIEQFNWSRDLSRAEQPSTLEPYLDETQKFTDYLHKDTLFKILRLFARALKLPSEEYFVERHKYEGQDVTWARIMAYYDEHTEEDLQNTRGVWLMGHADPGSITLLFSQPMASLQIRQGDGTWRWAKHHEGAIVVNAGEMMQFWTGGYYKATVHRGARFLDIY